MLSWEIDIQLSAKLLFNVPSVTMGGKFFYVELHNPINLLLIDISEPIDEFICIFPLIVVKRYKILLMFSKIFLLILLICKFIHFNIKWFYPSTTNETLNKSVNSAEIYKSISQNIQINVILMEIWKSADIFIFFSCQIAVTKSLESIRHVIKQTLHHQSINQMVIR